MDCQARRIGIQERKVKTRLCGKVGTKEEEEEEEEEKEEEEEEEKPEDDLKVRYEYAGGE